MFIVVPEMVEHNSRLARYKEGQIRVEVGNPGSLLLYPTKPSEGSEVARSVELVTRKDCD
jgi:hypothetical protein